MIARELEKTMHQQSISKSEMARRLHTSRTGVDRLLDPENTAITLNTLAKVATVLGKRIDFTLRCCLSPLAVSLRAFFRRKLAKRTVFAFF